MSGHGLLLRWGHIQGSLFAWLREEVGELTLPNERIVLVLDTLDVETHVPGPPVGCGHPPKDRRAIARDATEIDARERPPPPKTPTVASTDGHLPLFPTTDRQAPGRKKKRAAEHVGE